MKVQVGYDEEGQPVDNLADAALIIEAEYDEDGELINETFLTREGSPGVLPVS